MVNLEAEQTILTGIDHPIIAVRDMTGARTAYERLGFTVTPRGRHREWGTGNWCVMFENDYLELRGVIDPQNPHNLDRILAVREGLMGIAFGTKDAEASCAALGSRGVQVQPVKRLTREFELPEGVVQPRFALCFPTERDTPGLLSVVFCQHLTPELLRRPEWLRHANGAVGVRKATGVVPDLTAAANAHARLFGERAIDQQRDRLTIRVNDRQTIELVTPEHDRETFATDDLTEGEPREYLLSISIEVDDVANTRRYLASQGVEFHQSPEGSLLVATRDACGVPIEFIERT